MNYMNDLLKDFIMSSTKVIYAGNLLSMYSIPYTRDHGCRGSMNL